MKRKIFLHSDKAGLALHVFFHLAILIPFLCMVLASRTVHVDADLLNMLPQSAQKKAMQRAEKRLTEQNGRSLIVLVSHEDFAKAKESAVAVYDALCGNRKFSSVTLYSGESSLADVMAYVHEHRFHLLDDESVNLLSTAAGAQTFAKNALAKAYGMFTISSLENLASDPFLLDEYELQQYLAIVQDSGTAVSPKDGVLAVQHEGRWYVMLSMTLSREGAALASSNNGVAEIYRVCTPLEKDGVRFVYSGTPFHSYKSSRSASREITVISTSSFLLVIIMLIFVFRTPVPIIASASSILLAAATGFSATYCLFHEVHALVLVFATSLIGCCIDCSLHFFLSWKADRSLADGFAVRRSLIKGLTLSLVSTELCYACLLFAPFMLLRQMAVFSCSGILSAYITSVCVFPLIPVPQENLRTIAFLDRMRIPHPKGTYTGLVLTFLLIAVSSALMGVFHKNVTVQNSLSRLYKMEGRLKEDSILSYKVLQYAPSSWFIVSGNSAEEVLCREEQLRDKISGISKDGCIATSRFIPSVERQKKSYAAAANLLPLAESQFDMLGFEPSYAQEFLDAYRNAEKMYVTPENEIPLSVASVLSSLWLGQTDGMFYSVVLPPASVCAQSCAEIASGTDGIWFSDKISDISTDLDSLTKIIMMLFVISYVVIFIVLRFFYSWRQTFKIASVPLLSVCAITAVFAATGSTIDFFAVTGMILVFGLGLDYVIYMMENRRHKDGAVEPFAILLSFLTTFLSFGTLALSSFVPVHLIGLSIVTGLSVAFLCTLL